MSSSRQARLRRRKWRKKTSRKKDRAEKAAQALTGMGEPGTLVDQLEMQIRMYNKLMIEEPIRIKGAIEL